MISAYTQFNDAGHGWLRVTRKELVGLGINTKISGYSYQKGDYVYLEEDSDLSTFLIAKFPNKDERQKFYLNSVRQSYSHHSPIRYYASYTSN